MPQGLRRTDKKGSVDITEHIKYNTVNMNMRAYTKKGAIKRPCTESLRIIDAKKCRRALSKPRYINATEKGDKMFNKASLCRGMKLLAGITGLVLLLCCAMPVFADSIAEEGRVSYEVSVSPKRVALPQKGQTHKVTVTVKVSTKQKDFSAGNFRFYLDDAEAPIYVVDQSTHISEENSAEISFSAELGRSDIGREHVVWAEYDAQGSVSGRTERHRAGSFTVKAEDSQAFVLSLVPDKTVVEKDGNVDFSGSITNNSGKDAENVFISFAGAYTGQYQDLGKIAVKDVEIGSLAAGEMRSFSFSVGSVQGDFSLTPTVASNHGNVKCEPVEIELKRAETQFYLVARPQASGKYNETVTIVYNVLNSGNVALSGIRLLDESNGEIRTNVTVLKPGETITGSVTMRITGDKNVRYTLTAQDSFGREYQTNSNGVDITLEASAEDIVMGITAVASPTALTGPGQVTFDISITNKSIMAVSNVRVSDDRGEEVQTIGTMDPQGSKTFKIVRTVEQTQNVFFVVTVTDSAGVEKRFETEVITVTVGENNGTAAPVTLPPDEPTPTAEPSKGNGAGRAVVIALCVVGGLIVLGVAALIVVNILQKRAARRSRKIRRRIK